MRSRRFVLLVICILMVLVISWSSISLADNPVVAVIQFGNNYQMLSLTGFSGDSLMIFYRIHSSGDEWSYSGSCSSNTYMLTGINGLISYDFRVLDSSGNEYIYIAKVNIGDIVTLGHYPQTSTGSDKSPIKWIVLDIKDEKALLISQYVLDVKPYDTEWETTTWQECSLRKWLNSSFINTAFTSTEQDAILTTEVSNGRIQAYFGWVTSYANGNTTSDRIFLLSYAEANKYFGAKVYTQDGADENMTSRAAATPYALARGAFTHGTFSSIEYTATGETAVTWWLRTFSTERNTGDCISMDGSASGSRCDRDDFGVRPVMWVNMNSGII